MIQSLFIITGTGEVIIEQHWRGTTSRSVCDFFWEEVNKHERKEDVPAVLASTKYCLLSVFRNDLFFLAVTQGEISPLFVIEFLHRVGDVFQDYFSTVSESSLKENFSTVYQLLEEMVDNGYPFTTEQNALKAMIAPPSTSSRLAAMVSGKSSVSEQLPDGTISSMPWRKAGVKYTQNEIYFDIVEEIDAIVDSGGRIISCEVTGTVNCNCHLSGVPDLTMVLTDPSVIDDCAFHPCVRYSRYERERVVSFVPPDGNFKLMDYTVLLPRMIPPVHCQPAIVYDNHGGGSVEVSVVPKQMPTLFTNSKKPHIIEDIAVTIPFPKSVRTVNLTASTGVALFDDSTKEVKWTIPKLQKHKFPTLSGKIVLNSPNGKAPDERPSILLDFSIPMTTVSGLSVETLLVSNEKYKPYKGVRTLTKAGRFQIRV